jgi:alpha-glucosidase
MTTKALREEDFELYVAPGQDGNAEGTLYLDDGESLLQNGVSEITFTWDGVALKMEGSFGFETNLSVKSFTVLGDGGRTHELNKRLYGPWEHRARGLKMS